MATPKMATDGFIQQVYRRNERDGRVIVMSAQ